MHWVAVRIAEARLFNCKLAYILLGTVYITYDDLIHAWQYEDKLYNQGHE